MRSLSRFERRLQSRRSFQESERRSSEVLAKYLNVDFETALETYRISRSAFTTDGIRPMRRYLEYLKEDARILGLAAPLPATRVFDFYVTARS